MSYNYPVVCFRLSSTSFVRCGVVIADWETSSVNIWRFLEESHDVPKNPTYSRDTASGQTECHVLTETLTCTSAITGAMREAIADGEFWHEHRSIHMRRFSVVQTYLSMDVAICYHEEAFLTAMVEFEQLDAPRIDFKVESSAGAVWEFTPENKSDNGIPFSAGSTCVVEPIPERDMLAVNPEDIAWEEVPFVPKVPCYEDNKLLGTLDLGQASDRLSRAIAGFLVDSEPSSGSSSPEQTS